MPAMVALRPELITKRGMEIVSRRAPGPIILVSSSVGGAERSVICPDTLENVITSTPGLREAFVNASRKEPGPASKVFVTTKVAARPQIESVSNDRRQRLPTAFVR